MPRSGVLIIGILIILVLVLASAVVTVQRAPILPLFIREDIRTALKKNVALSGARDAGPTDNEE